MVRRLQFRLAIPTRMDFNSYLTDASLSRERQD